MDPLKREAGHEPVSSGEITGAAHLAGPPEGGGDRQRFGRFRLWALALAAGLVGGSVAWFVGESLRHEFRPSPAASPPGGFPGDSPLMRQEKAAYDAKSMAVAYGVLGVSLGAALGLAGGLVRRSSSAGAVAALVGTLLAGAAGAGAAFLLTPLFGRYFDPDQPTLLLPLLIHGGVSAAIGAAAGLAFAMGLGQRGLAIRSLLGGLVGGLLGRAVFELVHAVAFPLAQSQDLIPSAPGVRLLSFACVALAVAVGVALLAIPGGARTATPSELT